MPTTSRQGVLRPSESTTALPSAAPAGGTGATAGAYDTAANRNAAITTINDLRTIVNELRTSLSDVIRILRSEGILE